MQGVVLGLLGAMLPVGHHSLHEVMLAAELFGKDFGYPELFYDNSWGRYWRLPLLTEEELRQHVAREGKFPDEHALQLMELPAGHVNRLDVPGAAGTGRRPAAPQETDTGAPGGRTVGSWDAGDTSGAR
jgi:hypothetical protein